MILGVSTNGYQIISYDDMEAIREADKATPNPYAVFPQKGGQEKLLSCNADIIIYGGCRGGGKSFGLLCEVFNDIYSQFFQGVLLRNEIGDLETIVSSSRLLYGEFGDYNKSKNDMTWNFNNGGALSFSYFADSLEDFMKRFQGKEYPYIGIDEVTHISFPKFRYLMSDCRNSHFIRNRIIGTCNPDPDSWVAKMIDWWITDYGTPDPERDGVVRYCFMGGDNIEDTIWGDTREDVYNQCRGIIDRYWKPEYAKYGSPADLFIKSVTFIEGRLADNEKLMRSDPTYLSNLLNQSEEQRLKDLEGNWRRRVTGKDIISISNMEDFFSNSVQSGDGVLRASCDVAFSGGDNLVMWLYRGWHIEDIFVLRGADSRKAIEQIKYTLDKWGVREENFTYDLSGIGQGLKGFFPKATPFNNLESPIDVPRGTYDYLKSQCAFLFAEKLVAGEISINPDLLDRRFSGDGFSKMRLRDILMVERKAIRAQEDSLKGKALVKKIQSKKIIGHSPDFVEALFMIIIFSLKHKRKITGLGWL